MRYLCLTVAMAWAGVAQAHPGHLAEAAGHGHWLGAAAIGAAIAIGLWAGLKGRGSGREAPAEAEEDKEGAEAAQEPREA